MGIPCSKRFITLFWGIFECLFFSGILNGWIWMQQIMKEDGYFIGYCNTSHLHHIGLKSNVAQNDFGDLELGIDDAQHITLDKGTKMKCVFRHEIRIVSLKEYARLTATTTTSASTEVVQGPGQVDMADIYCDEQDDQLELVISLVVIVRNMLMLPFGILLDKYGTSRIRLVSMSCSAFGSLLMLFSSQVYPWLIFPALLMLGLSGSLLLLTDIQIANMFGTRRYTIMSMFVGSYFSGGIVILFMKLTRDTGVNLQTSFMFVTIGIVPVLISTIAMLPRSRIPWPMPAGYGKQRAADDQYAKHRTSSWSRRISAGGKKRADMPVLSDIIRSPMYICMVVWVGIINLKSFVFDMNIDVRLQSLTSQDKEYMSLYAMLLLLSLPVSPLIGVVMDWKKFFVSSPHVQQMRNILYAMVIVQFVSICSTVVTMVPNTSVQVAAFLLTMVEKVTMHCTLFAFLTHVHFPNEHFGKCAGIVLASSGVFLLVQYPLRLLIYNTRPHNMLYVQLLLLVAVIIASIHPINLWYQCKQGNIHDLSQTPNPQAPVTIMLMETQTEPDGETYDNGKKTDNGAKTVLQVTDL